jgi:hypothetical protein
VEPEGSLSRSEEPSTDFYPKPDLSNPYHTVLSLLIEVLPNSSSLSRLLYRNVIFLRDILCSSLPHTNIDNPRNSAILQVPVAMQQHFHSNGEAVLLRMGVAIEFFFFLANLQSTLQIEQ